MLPTVDAHVAQVQAPGELHFEDELLVLEGMGGNEIAAETLYSAISPGTELAAFDGMRPLRPDRAFSNVVGYCNLARLIGVGEWVRGHRVGDLVLTLQSHRSHFICGAEDILLRLPEGEYGSEQLENAATTYLFHQGYSALLRGDLKPGQYVAVVGLGTLGLATVAVAARFGARVVGFSDQPAAREMARAFGAVAVYEKGDEGSERGVREATAGTGIDIVVLTGSGWSDWQAAVELARPGGCVSVLGFPGRREPIPPFNPLDPGWFYRKQLTIVAAGYTPDVDIAARDIRFTIRRNCAYLLDLIRDGDLPARELISLVAPWHQLTTVYERMARREDGFFTAVLDWTVDAP